jgi:hypothetical protein
MLVHDHPAVPEHSAVHESADLVCLGGENGIIRGQFRTSTEACIENQEGVPGENINAADEAVLARTFPISTNRSDVRSILIKNPNPSGGKPTVTVCYVVVPFRIDRYGGGSPYPAGTLTLSERNDRFEGDPATFAFGGIADRNDALSLGRGGRDCAKEEKAHKPRCREVE